MSELPESWLQTKFGEVVDYGVTDKVEPSAIADDAWILELEDIEKDSSKTLGYYTFGHRKSKSTKNAFSKGDVLYGKLRPYLNKLLLAASDGYCTTEIVPIKPTVATDNRFVFYWLKSSVFVDYATEVSHGLNMPRLGTEAGRNAPFVLAPFAEQKRIADKLDALLARVDAARARLDRIPGLLKRFRQSVLAAATSGELTEEWRALALDSGEGGNDEWEKKTFGELAEDLRYGTSKKCEYKKVGVGVLRIPNISDAGRVDVADLKFATFDKSEVGKLSLQAGDLLVIRSNGSVDLVGKVGLVTDAEAGLLFAGYLMRLRLDTARVLPKFAYLCMSTMEQRHRIEITSKSTSGINNINAEELRGLPLSLPPLQEQTEIVRRVETLFAIADKVQAQYTAARARIDKLTAAILSKAFRGELVPQDPNDEPASVLLARLRAQRDAVPAQPRRGRKPAQ